MLNVVVYAKALVRVGEMALFSNKSRRPVLCENLVFDTKRHEIRNLYLVSLQFLQRCRAS
jgi:hypothetical protein